MTDKQTVRLTGKIDKWGNIITSILMWLAIGLMILTIIKII